jgi:DNA polymerase alpha subunit A
VSRTDLAISLNQCTDALFGSSGLDPTRYKNKAAAVAEEEKALNPLQSQIPDAERFAECQPFKVKCPACQSEFQFDSLTENTVSLAELLTFDVEVEPCRDLHQAGLITSTGIFCANFECSQPIATACISLQLELQIRSFITQFYEGWLVCDDAACENRTRMMSVYGKRCLAAPCRGQMHYEYSDGKLYNQLLYFDGLFNSDSAKARVLGTSRFGMIQFPYSALRPKSK